MFRKTCRYEIIILLLLFIVVKMEHADKISFLSVDERIKRAMHLKNSDIFDWAILALNYSTNKVNSLKQIYTQLELLSKSPFGHAKLQNLTLKTRLARNTAITRRGNYIPFMNISVGSYVRKPCIVVVGGIYGSDWLTVTAAMNLINEFVLNYYRHTTLLEKVTWIIIPVLNPDGYNETLSNKTMRNWQKNMAQPNNTNHTEEAKTDAFNYINKKKNMTEPYKPKPKKNCFGVNLPLNFEYQWIHYNYTTASWCDENFADKPFSQNESAALRDTIRDNLDTVKIFLTVRQLRRAFTYPFRYTKKKPLFHESFEHIVREAAEAAHNKYGREFKYGHILKFEEESAGGMDDWIKAHFDVDLAFTCFISDWNNNNRRLSAHEIKQTNEETLAALRVFGIKGVEFDELKTLSSSIGIRMTLINRPFVSFVVIIILFFKTTYA